MPLVGQASRSVFAGTTLKQTESTPTAALVALALCNVAEWEDACTAGEPSATTVCRTRGGSYLSDANGAKCETDDGAVLTTKSPTIGFRCCADL